MLSVTLSAATATINSATTNQFIRGFGASSAWNGQGTLAPAAAALFADDNLDGHAGLSILRTRIDPGGAFANEAGPMTLAKAQNPNILIWSTEWTPPAAYKNNNNVNGPGANNTFNNTAANSTAYANYLVNYIKTIKTNYGVDLYAISPQNEPDWNTSYESCIWTAAQFNDFVKNYLAPALSSNGLTTKIMIPESFSDNLAMAADSMNDAVTAPLISIIGNHIYGGGPRNINTGGWSHLTNQESWETEMSDVSGATHDPGMPAALQIMGWLYSCIVTANMNAYLHWWIYSYTGENSGLYGTDTTTPTKKLYALGNFSKFVRPGYYRMGGTIASGSAGVNVAAFKDNAGAPNRYVIVAINTNASTVSQTFTLSSFNSTSCTPWVTDATRNLAHQAQIAITGNSFTYTLPAQSVVSFVGYASVVGTLTPTPTYPGTNTPSPTASPTPYTQLFDDFEDVNSADNWGGTWAAYAGSASALTLTVAAGGAPGSTLGSGSVVGTIGDYGGLTGTFSGSPRDLSAYVGIQFMVKGSGTYWWQVATAAVTDGDHYGASFTASGTWTLVTIYFSNLTQRGWGTAVPMDLTASQYFQWASNANGAFNLQIDDVKLLTYTSPPTYTRTATRTPSPANSATFTRTATPTATRTPSPANSATFTGTVTPTATRSPSPANSATFTPSPTPSATRTASPANSATFTPSQTPSATRTASPVNSATFTPSQTPSSTRTASPVLSPTMTPSVTSTATQALGSPTSTPSASAVLPSSTASPTKTALPSSPTDSPTLTASVPSLTATPTKTALPGSPTDTPTSTALVPSLTATPTKTTVPGSPTDTPTSTVLVPSDTASPTLTVLVPSATATPTQTLIVPSLTATPTQTVLAPSATATPSVTPPASATRSVTLTVTPSATRSATPTSTRTVTPLPSATASPSATPTLSPTPQPLASATVSPSATRTAVEEGPLLIEQAVAWPNPSPKGLSLKMAGPAESVLVKLYSPAWICLGQQRSQGLFKGWNRVALPSALDDAPNGLFYFVVQAEDGARHSPSVTGKLYRLR